MTMPVAFLKGQEDYAKGVSARDCPYDFDSKEAKLWLNGWNEAMNDNYEIYEDITEADRPE